jgi:hypothetical protein
LQYQKKLETSEIILVEVNANINKNSLKTKAGTLIRQVFYWKGCQDNRCDHDCPYQLGPVTLLIISNPLPMDNIIPNYLGIN